MKPLICFDLDGTLIDANGRIHPRDMRLLAEPVDAYTLVPATGRPLAAVRGAFGRNGLFADQPLPYPLVLLNGAMLFGPGEVPSGYSPLVPGLQRQLLDVTASFQDVTFWFLSPDTIDEQWPSDFATQEAGRFDFTIREIPAPADGSETAYGKIMCVSKDRGRLMEIAKRIKNLPVQAAFTMDTLLEITAADVDKYRGLRALTRRLGLEQAPIYAAGDGENDLALFQHARLSFAPVTSPAHVREAATHVIDVSRDGLLTPILQEIGFLDAACDSTTS